MNEVRGLQVEPPFLSFLTQGKVKFWSWALAFLQRSKFQLERSSDSEISHALSSSSISRTLLCFFPFLPSPMSLPLSSSQLLNRAYIILLFSSLVLFYAGLTTFGCLGIHREEGKSKVSSLFLLSSSSSFLSKLTPYLSFLLLTDRSAHMRRYPLPVFAASLDPKRSLVRPNSATSRVELELTPASFLSLPSLYVWFRPNSYVIANWVGWEYFRYA